MDLPIVLSHKTAWLYHNVARPSEPLSRASSLYDEDSLASEAEPTADLPKLGLDAKGLRASTAVGIVTDYLVSLGIPREELGHIDTLVNFDFERSTPLDLGATCFGGAGYLQTIFFEVAEGLLVVDEVMCFVQAGSWMSEPEQLEYGYEICARYHLNHLSTDDYVEMGQRYTVADLIAYCNENRSRQGAIRAAAVIKRVHDGARSPMETATAIMVVAKRSQGGLGYAKIELNHRVDVPNEFKYLAKAGYFEIDVYAPASGTGIEYNGSDHLDKQRSASDAERMTVLSALGFRMIVLTGTQFAHQLQLHRAMNAIALAMGLKCDRSEAFQKTSERPARIRDSALGRRSLGALWSFYGALRAGRPSQHSTFFFCQKSGKKHRMM